MNGVLNVYKEQGFTSHDVVAKLRGILKTKKSVTQARLTLMRSGCFLCASVRLQSCVTL